MRISALFSAAAILVYSYAFSAPFAIPKLIVLTIGVLALSGHLATGGQVKISPALVSGVAFIGISSLSGIFGDQWLALVGRYNSYALGVLGLLVALIYGSCAQDDGGILATTGAILGLFALSQEAFGFGLIGHRAVGTIGNPTQLGVVLAMLLPFAVEASYAHATAVVIGLAAAGSRGAWLAAIAGLVATVFSTRNRARHGRTLGALAVIALLAVVCRPHSYRRSDIDRSGTWKAALSSFAEHPVLGVGADGFGQAFLKHASPDFKKNSAETSEDAHNDVLQVLATTGILGLIAYAFFNYFAFTQTVGIPLGAISALFVCAKFNPVPLEALVLGSTALGLGSAAKPVRLPNIARVGFVFLAVAVSAFVCRLGVADYHAKPGTLAGLLRADQLNPYELTYKVRTINAGVLEINATRDRELRAAILMRLRGEAAQAITLRPKQAMAWRIAGAEAQIERDLGIKRNPMMYFNRARALDPTGAM